MKGKFLFVAGAAVGYVLGARAGRGAYVKIKDRAEGIWENPSVQKGVAQAESFVKENAPVVGQKVKEAASTGAAAVSDTASKVSSKGGSKAQDAASKASDAEKGAADKVSEKTDQAVDAAEKGKATEKLPGVNPGE
ncbi:YtxH domain-containing protein [Frigoribacterium salinisoli]